MLMIKIIRHASGFDFWDLARGSQEGDREYELVVEVIWVFMTEPPSPRTTGA